MNDIYTADKYVRTQNAVLSHCIAASKYWSMLKIIFLVTTHNYDNYGLLKQQ